MKIHRALLQQGINSYSTEGDLKKKAFHLQGKKFLKALAKELGIEAACDVRSNLGGMAVSGEVTLHGEGIYVQLYESCVGGRGISVLYRSCKGRKDYSGGQNHSAKMSDFDDTDYNEGKYERFVAQLKKLSQIQEYA